MSIWGNVIQGVAEVGGSFLSSSGGDDGGDRTTTSIQPVQPRTTGTAQISDFDIMYNQQAQQDMSDLTDKLDQWSNIDQDFYQNTFQPFQESIISTNTALLPTIEKVAGRTLEQNAKDLTSNEHLKNSFRQGVTGAERDTSKLNASLMSQLDNIPTEAEAAGRALAQVESQFGEAGKALTRDFQSRGQAVTQASKRDLEFQKARAGAGAAGAATEAARRERLAATANVADVAGRRSAQTTSQLLGVQSGQQAGLATPQVGGVTPSTGLEGARIQADLSKAGAGQVLGNRSREDQVTQIQAGVKSPTMTSGATGQVPAGGVVQGEPATDGTGALITPGSAGATLSSGRDTTRTSGGAMAGVIRDMFNTGRNGGTSPR